MEKKQVKLTALIKLFSICFFVGWMIVVFITDPPTLKSAKTVKEAKKVVDYYMNNWNKTYSSLCKEARNDKLKMDFSDLAGSINSAYGCGGKCVNLSYSEQSEVSRYAIQKLNEYPNLITLSNTGKIECW